MHGRKSLGRTYRTTPIKCWSTKNSHPFLSATVQTSAAKSLDLLERSDIEAPTMGGRGLPEARVALPLASPLFYPRQKGPRNAHPYPRCSVSAIPLQRL